MYQNTTSKLILLSLILFTVACDQEIRTKQGTFWLNGQRQLLWSGQGACQSKQAGCQAVQVLTPDGKATRFALSDKAEPVSAVQLASLAATLKDASLSVGSQPDLKLADPSGMAVSMKCTEGRSGRCTGIEAIIKGVGREPNYVVGWNKGQIVLNPRIPNVVPNPGECRCCPTGDCCREATNCRILDQNLIQFKISSLPLR